MSNNCNINMAISEALFSASPHVEYAEKLSLFGQFIGSWDIDVIRHLPDGNPKVVSGEWHFAWALEGRAIIDVWIAPRRELRIPAIHGVGEYGATLRFYDPDIDAWRSTWIGPTRHNVFPFIGRQVKDEIVMEGRFEEGILSRWIFSDIQPDAFKWRAIESNDEWVTHHLLQQIVARRAVPKDY